MYFTENASALAIHRPRTPNEGLRIAQLGAAWAIGAHFTKVPEGERSVAALVVMPTGSGKTAVMTLAPFLTGATRVLVVAPSRLVRDQVEREFKALGVLRRASVAAKTFPSPRVHLVRKRIADAAQWEALRQYDVVVATPQAISPALAAIPSPPDDLFDMVIMDEAHHAAATTWNSLIDAFPDAMKVLFTATPFRRDERRVPGELVYRYSLRKAVADRVFRPIDFEPVTVQAGHNRDESLARVALELLGRPEYSDSRLLVRTDRADDAEALVAVYESIGLPVGVILSRKSLRQNREVLKGLEDGTLRGVVSVGVLGEGFDLPRLKVAVYHRQHRSLAATLQFIGRIARADDAEPVHSVLIAERGEVNDETAKLYEADAYWAELVPQLTDAAIDAEQDRRKYADQFEVPDDIDVSPQLIRPKLHVRVFSGDVAAITLTEANLSSLPRSYVGVDEPGDLMVIVERRRTRPSWYAGSDLDGVEFHLDAIVVDRGRGLLFVSSDTEARGDAIRGAIGGGALRQVPPRALNSVLRVLAIEHFSSVGLSSTRRPGRFLARYKTVSSSEVEGAVTAVDGRGYRFGHGIGRYRGDDGLTRTIGTAVRRAKIWSNRTESLFGFRAWCDEIGTALTQPHAAGDGRVPLLPLTMPEQLEHFPPIPLGAVMPLDVFESDLVLDAEGMTHPLAEMNLEVDSQMDRCTISLWNQHGIVVTVTSDVHGIFSSDAATEVFSQSSPHERLTLCEFLNACPPTIYFAAGESVEGSILHRQIDDIPDVDPVWFQSIDWGDTDIESEVGDRTPKWNVQQRVIKDAVEKGALVIRDDGSQEIADVIAISAPTDDQPELYILLSHCKASSEPLPGARVEDVYECSGQVIKSWKWAELGVLPALRDRLQARASTHVESAHTLEEALAILTQAIDDGVPVRREVQFVQPGLSLEKLRRSAGVRSLLINSAEWTHQQGAHFRVVCSA